MNLYQHKICLIKIVLTSVLLSWKVLLFGQTTVKPFVVIERVNIEGNKKTVPQIIKRELTFQIGDTILLTNLTDVFAENRDNLLKTSLFNYVTLTLDNVYENRASIKIMLEERWYIWPEIYLAHADRNLSNWIRTGDFSRIKYGLGVSHYNFRGRKEKLGVLFISGFVNRYGLSYNNFYLDKALKHSLSLELLYDTPKKLVYNVQNNVEQVLKTDDILIDKKEGYLQYMFRQHLYLTHSLRSGILNYQVSDTIVSSNPEFLTNQRKKAGFFTVSYTINYDRLNSNYYPTTGYQASFRAKKVGLPNNVYDFWQLKQVVSYYQPIPIFNWPLYIGTVNKFKLSTIDQRPLFMYDEIGYRDNLRGFEFYVINGKYAWVSYNSLKLRLIETQIIEVPYVPIPSVNKVHLTPYLNIFADFGYVGRDNLFNQNKDNFLTDQLLSGVGIGIDLVTYYDRVLSFYYAYNSLNKGGIYVNLSSGF